METSCPDCNPEVEFSPVKLCDAHWEDWIDRRAAAAGWELPILPGYNVLFPEGNP